MNKRTRISACLPPYAAQISVVVRSSSRQRVLERRGRSVGGGSDGETEDDNDLKTVSRVECPECW